MTINEINALAKKHNELKKELEEVKDLLRAETKAHGDRVETDNFKLSVTIVVSERFDTKRFKAENPDTASEYITESITERFTVKGVK